MRTIGEYMSRCPATIDCCQSLAEATELMQDRGIHHLPVVDRGRLVGVLSERDVLRLESRKGVDPEVLPVGEAMSPDPLTVRPTDSLAEVALRMAEKNYGSVLVVDGGALAGVFTASDALRALASLLGRARPA